MKNFSIGDSVAVYHMVNDRSGRRYKGRVVDVSRSSLKVKFAYRNSDDGGRVAWFWKQQCRRLVRARSSKECKRD
jgi:hypothetical protein